MNPSQKSSKGRKIEISAQIAELARLLGMIPSDDTIHIQEPLTQKHMILSDWLMATRESFFKLSLLISKELDLELQ